MKNAFIHIALFVMAASCSQPSGNVMSSAELQAVAGREMNVQEFNDWFAATENPHTRSQQVGDKTYRLVHLPAQLLALREAGKDAGDSALKAAETLYSELEYFRLEITGTTAKGELLKQDVGNAGEYQRRVSYSAFGMEKDIVLVADGTDSIPCALFHFERSFDVAPVASFMIAFDRKRVTAADKLTFVFHDDLFRNGLLKFSFTKEELLAVPKLNP